MLPTNFSFTLLALIDSCSFLFLDVVTFLVYLLCIEGLFFINKILFIHNKNSLKLFITYPKKKKGRIDNAVSDN